MDGSGIRRIVVVGGGTAGWLAAWIMKENIARNGRPLELVMVESSAIPTIGVGEGTTAVFKGFLDHFNLDEASFLRETRATYKLGIRHRNWRSGAPYYDGPIDDPHWSGGVPGPPGAELLNVHAVAEGRRVAESHHFTHLMRADKVPFRRNGDGTLSRVSEFENAYHFDNAKVAGWLRAQGGGGLRIVDAVVEGVVREPGADRIAALQLADGSKLEGDFFIDCTGFRRLLTKALGGDAWVGYGAELPLNRAFPFQLPLRDGEPVHPYTHAWALDSGWMWQIPTQDRIGNGYAYCDAYATPEQAHAEVERALGTPVEPLADIRFDVGRLRSAWNGNCLAVGLAAGFLEPLEATSIHSTLIQLLLFDRDHFAGALDAAPDEIARYNEAVGRQFDDFRTFLVVHYRGGRADTPFWRDVRADRLEAMAARRLAGWRERMPSAADFEGFLDGLPHVEAQLYYPVLDGLKLLDRKTARRDLAASGLGRQVAEVWRRKVAEAKEVAARAMDHGAFLRAVDEGARIVLPGSSAA